MGSKQEFFFIYRISHTGLLYFKYKIFYFRHVYLSKAFDFSGSNPSFLYRVMHESDQYIGKRNILLFPILSVIFLAVSAAIGLVSAVIQITDKRQGYVSQSPQQKRFVWSMGISIFILAILFSLVGTPSIFSVIASSSQASPNTPSATLTLPPSDSAPNPTPTPTHAIDSSQNDSSSQPTNAPTTANTPFSKPIPTSPPTPYSMPSPTPTPTTISPVNETYEAEAVPPNTLGEHAYIESGACSKCSGGLLVFNIGTAPGPTSGTYYYNGTLQFNTVSAPKDGTYSLTIFYCDYYRSNTDVYISVNGDNAFKLHYPAVGNCRNTATPVGQITCQVYLHQGSNNTILFSNPNDFSSYIDKIAITYP